MENMSTYEKCKRIRQSLLTRVGEALSYNNWHDEFKLKNIVNIYDSINSWEESCGSFEINPTELSVEEMKDLGFCSWSKDNPILLIPLWIYPFLASEFECESISGSKHFKLSELDNDHRFGCLAYGVVPKQK